MAADPRTAERVALCGWFAAAGVVEIRTIAASVYPAQLIVCARPWQCAVCSAKIRHRKAVELGQMVEAHAAAGRSVTFAVLTAGDHHLGEPFDLTMGVLRKAWTSATRGAGQREYVRLRSALGILGNSQAPEITHLDGWHPHLNVLWWHDRQLSPAEAAEMLAGITLLWRAAINAQGRYLHPRHGVRVIPNATHRHTGEYVAKVQDDWTLGAEMTRGDVKTPRRPGGRLPFTIVADHYRTGDLGDWRLWSEYSRGVLTGGERSIAIVRHSPGLRAALGVRTSTDGLSDEQLAAIEVGGQLLATIAQHVWRRLRMRRVAAEMLAAAEAGGLPGLNGWLAGHGLPLAVPGYEAEQLAAAAAIRRRLVAAGA